MQERNEKAVVNWHRALALRPRQRVASAQRHDAIRVAAKQAVLASAQADKDSVVPQIAAIGQHFSQQQEHEGSRSREAISSKSSGSSGRTVKGLLLLLQWQ